MSLGANTMSTLVVPNSGCRTIAAFNAFLQMQKKSFLFISLGNISNAVLEHIYLPYKGPNYAIISIFVFDRNLTFSESYEVFRKYYA